MTSANQQKLQLQIARDFLIGAYARTEAIELVRPFQKTATEMANSQLVWSSSIMPAKSRHHSNRKDEVLYWERSLPPQNHDNATSGYTNLLSMGVVGPKTPKVEHFSGKIETHVTHSIHYGD
ncbi:conserved hypothetical protein [Ricinus communis]|uniref:Uncharacterized protein n=1 Tax=Ricinus communis TaxID=3988 RepID=B9SZ61_RICCO|nr:conserved hypothetical protein [Ricinus communis]